MDRELQRPQPQIDVDPSTRKIIKPAILSRVFNPLNRLILAGALSFSVGALVVSEVEAGGDDTGNRNANHDKNERNDRNRQEQRKHDRKSNDNNNGNSNDNNSNDNTEISTVNEQRCAQKLTGAYNPQTGEKVIFPTPCDVPAGWMPINQLR